MQHVYKTSNSYEVLSGVEHHEPSSGCYWVGLRCGSIRQTGGLWIALPTQSWSWSSVIEPLPSM